MRKVAIFINTLLGFVTGLAMLYLVIKFTGYTVSSWFESIAQDTTAFGDWLVTILFIGFIILAPTVVSLIKAICADGFLGYVSAAFSSAIISVIVVIVGILVMALIFGIITLFANIFEGNLNLIPWFILGLVLVVSVPVTKEIIVIIAKVRK